MILYDDKHNFLGMSTHTLGFLGYEDVSEFLSMHNDFSNLFVQKEGFIYDFDNFNWIDFVLYSGAANKSAIITLKNGQETKVDLSIKEVHLGHELNGIKKLYSVKVISDKFHEISGVPKSSESSESIGGVGGFSLSGLVEKEEKVELASQEPTIQNLIIATPQVEEEKSESFILNITEDTIVVKEEIAEENCAPDIQEDFKLDFFKEETSAKIPEETSDFILKEAEVNDDASISDFLLKSDDSETITSKDDTLLSSTEEDEVEKRTESFTFNLLKEEEIPPNLESDILTTQKSDTEEEVIEEGGFKLDFLKADFEPKSEPEESTVEKVSDELSLNTDKNRELIQQIKKDIKEIDEPQKVKQTEEKTFVLDIPEMPQVEQPLTIDREEERADIDHQKSQSNFQIQESKSKDSNKSFTSTLQGLFGNKTTLDVPEETHNTQEAYSFNLKRNDDAQEEEKFENEEKETFSFKDNSELEDKEPAQNTIQEISRSSLSALGLTPDDEFDLLSDFINDTKESIETIEEFTKTKDFDKINYSLVKIKSSAEILNLNDIIDNANSIRKHCITENSEKVIQETQKLKENIEMLEKQLEATAI